MTFRIFIANASPQRIAEIGQGLDMKGTVFGEAIGFGSWGIEPTVVTEMTDQTHSRIRLLVDAILAEYPDEEAVHVIAGRRKGKDWYRDGRVI